jgi:hypothetical protein
MDEPKIKLYKPVFDQRRNTPDSELRPSPVRHYAKCRCVTPAFPERSEWEGEPDEWGEWVEPKFHREIQDTSCQAWLALEAYVEKVAAKGSEEFSPPSGIGSELWEQIVTLPSSIKKLQSVKYVGLYGSHLVRIPPEMGDMTSLEEFDPYTSYKLHWFPYEITRCRKLKSSRVSTRALYGNYKYRPPFPRLPCEAPEIASSTCSICCGSFGSSGPLQRWISLGVGTDVLPLLVNACSNDCIQRLPKPADRYVPYPHQGGLKVEQPPPKFGLPGAS